MATWKGMLSSFNHVAPNISTQQHRFGSSSSLPDTQCPPLPVQFLEAYDGQKFDPSTHQRNDVPFDPSDGKPPPPTRKDNSKLVSWKNSPDSDSWCLTTKNNESDSKPCHYPNEWIGSQAERWRADANDFDCSWSSLDSNTANKIDTKAKRILWSNWTESTVRDPTTSPILFQYDDLVRNSDNTKNMEQKLLKVLHQYGLVLVRGTPTYTESIPLDVMGEATKTNTANIGRDTHESAESAILHLASMIGYHPLQTLYGSGVWSTSSSSSFYNNDGNATGGADGSSSASTADSAYGSTSLPLHTDMTYMSTPPGVQVFLMVQPATTTPAADGNYDDDTFVPKGQSVYLDGFAAAQQLLLENPEAFHLLATTPRKYRCIDDDEGWHLEATGPIIETVPGGKNEWGPVKSIRHNDLDRLPDLPPYPTLDTANNDIHNDSFYHKLREAHDAWDDILRRDSMRLVIDLQPGDCVLVANQRCLHARYAFETSTFPRVVMGCYVGMDEVSSKWRKAGLHVL